MTFGNQTKNKSNQKNTTQMRFFRIIAVLMLFITASTLSFAQKPKWISEGAIDFNNTYLENALGEGRTLQEARSKAIKAIVERRNVATGAPFQINTDSRVVFSAIVNDTIVVKSMIRDEYIERLIGGGYRVYILAQTARNPYNAFEPVTVTSQYPFSVRSLVPGMQQLYKGQTFKGIAFITGEVACIGAAVVAEGMRSDYSQKAEIQRNVKQKVIYVDKANNMQTVRNISIGTAAALYVWNIVDALVTKGANYVLLSDLNLKPMASSDGFGLSISYNF